jgi:quercetin dioxygenase-like cupin family protein
MTEPTHRDRPLYEPSGSPQRPSQRLAGPLLSSDVAAELARLRAEESFRGGDRNARTLVAEPELRVVLAALMAGARRRGHRAPGPITIQAVEWWLRIGASGETIELGAGQMLALDRDVPHDIEALEEGAFLPTIGRPKGCGADDAALTGRGEDGRTRAAGRDGRGDRHRGRRDTVRPCQAERAFNQGQGGRRVRRRDRTAARSGGSPRLATAASA